MDGALLTAVIAAVVLLLALRREHRKVRELRRTLAITRGQRKRFLH